MLQYWVSGAYLRIQIVDKSLFWGYLKKIGAIITISYFCVVAYKNYYQILGIAPGSDVSAIKQAYRKLAQRFHPDKNPDDPFSAQLFTEINEAYSVLSDPVKRRKYEQSFMFNASQHYRTYPADGFSRSSQLSSTEFIYDKIVAIKSFLSNIDPYRMNTDALYMELTELFSAYHLAILQKEKNQDKIDKLLDELLPVIAPLSIKQQYYLTDLFKTMSHQRHSQITAHFKHQKQIRFWQKYQLLFALIITILICVIIYLSIS